MYGCLRSSFTIYNRTISTVQCAPSQHIPRVRAPYTVNRYGDFILNTFPSCFLSKGEQILFSIELVDIIVLGGLLLCMQSFI